MCSAARACGWRPGDAGAAEAPVAGALNPAELAEWVVRDRLPVRFQLQLHKILWNDARGR